ncbi:TetR/AcrR family transcriptional regulator [Mycoplasmatota bacterium]|nr:TetR/AcrR family transcriptional regulator [Mycoplasmatota bacterium]
MGRENKNKIIAELHRKNILCSAEELFKEQGFINTTINDISRLSEYSRRTIYSYFNSKEEILNYIVLQGLEELLRNVTVALESSNNYLGQYKLICKAMESYYLNSPFSFKMVDQMQNKNIDIDTVSTTVKKIFAVGKEINDLLEAYIETGKKQGVFRVDIKTKETVYIMWSNIASLLSLINNKGQFIEKDTNTTKEEFLNYGYIQIINSILEERI